MNKMQKKCLREIRARYDARHYAKWEEEKHPRGEGGRFASKGTGSATGTSGNTENRKNTARKSGFSSSGSTVKKFGWKNAGTEEMYSAVKNAWEKMSGEKVSDEEVLDGMTEDTKNYLEPFSEAELRDWDDIAGDLVDFEADPDSISEYFEEYDYMQFDIEDALDTIRRFLEKSDAELYEALPKYGKEYNGGKYYGEPCDAFDTFSHGMDKESVEKGGGSWNELEAVMNAVSTLKNDKVRGFISGDI